MKILLGLHDESIYTVFDMYAKMSRSETTRPERMTAESTIEALASNPTRVLVDINLGQKGGSDYSPLLKIEEAMKTRGYDTKTALLGVSGRSDLIDEIRAKYPHIRVAEKPQDNEMIYSFLKGN